MQALQIAIPRWNITELNGYEPITTFWQDFSIVLNHKIWQWHERDNQRAILYDKLWREADAMTAEWSDEEQEYYFEITD